MKNLYAALLKAQQEFEPVPQDGKNSHLGNRYPTLAAVQQVALPVLNRNGLVVMSSVRTDWQAPSPLVYVGLAIVHAESCESVQNELALAPAKPDPQGIGSAITYGRRYLLMTMLGLSEADDDGDRASTPQAQRPPMQKVVQKAPPPPPVDNRLPGAEVDVSDRPKWQNSDEAKQWAEQFGVFNAPQHIKNAYAQAYTQAGGEKGKPTTPAIMERTFDLWYEDVIRRAAEREPELNGA